MSGRVTVRAECEACQGSGLYVGLCERDGFAVVCRECSGLGVKYLAYTPFIARRDRRDICVLRVLEVNPGVFARFLPGLGMQGFGGISLEDWKAGRGFPRGSEMREHCCPAWWGQLAGREMLGWVCSVRPGGSFLQCPDYDRRALCWQRWDAEGGGR